MRYNIEKAMLQGKYNSVEYGTSNPRKPESSKLGDILGYELLDAKKIINGMKLRAKKKKTNP